VEQISPLADGRWSLQAGEQFFTADAVVLAVSVDQVLQIVLKLPAVPGSVELESALGHYVLSPYITTHLWFDRAFTDLDHAALLDTTYQWMFHKSRIRGWPAEKGSYVELVIGGSRELLKAGRAELIETALNDLSQFFPDARRVPLVKSGVLKEARATFSVVPGMDRYRPAPTSPWKGLFFAGDWTATEWPSTMEGAARSGYLAAEALSGKSFLKSDLEATGLMRLLGL
jgi:zeta-carotene desaturase